jgi:hypothetical protein
MRASILCLTSVGLVGFSASAAAGQVQPQMDRAAVERLCGALEREAVAGRAAMVDVVACANAESARQLNAQMPMRVDEVTTVESVAAFGAEFVYNVRVEVDAAAVTGQMRDQLSAGTRNYVCNAADMRRTIGNGGSYRYRWADRSGRTVNEVLIDRC